MRRRAWLAAMVIAAILPVAACAQAGVIPSASPASQTGTASDRQGRKLLDEMVQALGGERWLNRQTVEEEGQSAAFYQGAPTGSVVLFRSERQLPTDGRPEMERVEYTKKHDVIHIWTTNQGYEITYKGMTRLPKKQVDDYLRRRAHSIEEVVRTWLKQPGVMLLPGGTKMVGRRLVDEVTVLSANNDAVTLDLDADSHLPRRRTFQWRNETYKDKDEDTQEYDDYHMVDGLPTAFTRTEYHNGDMTAQVFLRSVEYNKPLPPDAFDPNVPLRKQHRK